MKNCRFLSFLILFISLNLQAQDPNAPQRFDFGKMWTFENPPREWFKEAYNFTPEDKWYDDVRKASLRFATWCSASFVSPDGLIMTNHHCSRDVVTSLQQPGETLLRDGFYAKTLEEERKAEGLFVEQLIIAEDVTDKILKKAKSAKDDIEHKKLVDAALEELKSEYAQMDAWKNLRIQTVTYYSGGKFSLYGYKKYSDIRLVLIPENELGYFGGDPDNFTYPRYSLDFTFWRAYDENGKPLNTSSNYFKFNPAGAVEEEPVFVIGNPGSTERYRTVRQFEYDRNVRFPAQLKMMKTRRDLLQKEYDKSPSDALLNSIFNLGNGIKAISGILNGLRNPALFGRKAAMEKEIRSKTKLKDIDYWQEIEKEYDLLNKYGSSTTILGPSGTKGNAVNLMFALANYEKSLAGADSKSLEKQKMQIKELAKDLNSPKQQELLKVYFEEIVEFETADFKISDKLLDGKTPEKKARKILDKTDFADTDKIEKLLTMDAEKFSKQDDPLLEAARLIVPKYMEAVKAFQNNNTKRKSLEAKIANAVFQVKGNQLPPDATFTLRLSDGKVKAYDYNGTTAPVNTTFYGLYDRYYSFNKKFPWSLPERWLNPPAELLRSPFCFVTTNDIIGGNSGSPIINRNKEAIGLVFDGNIESLPGNFIYDEQTNRTVGVHAGGIFAALKYIYKAERITSELSK
ncbi:MAG: S46 family peptidase [Saprospiraceae bacterium]|nr:S46 family peptidase [Saprospiraceae bacterium]